MSLLSLGGLWAYNGEMACRKVRVEIKDREWMEFVFTLDDQQSILDVQAFAHGCMPFLKAAQSAAALFKGKSVTDLKWPSSKEHWDQVILEAISRAQQKYELPYKESELCHCRKVPTDDIERAIVLGAHTPERVKAWTTAGSGCGTCRPDVESMIEFRVADRCQRK